MAGNQRNLCAPIPVELHEKVCEERDKAGLTNGQYITALLTEYYDWKENGGNDMAKESGETRTLAVQIPAELADRIDEYLEQETKRRGYKLTKKDFIIGLVEKVLNEAEEALKADKQMADASIGEDHAEQKDEGREAPAEREDDSEAPAEPKDEGSEAPAGPEDATSENPDEGTQQTDSETGGDDAETQTE